MTTALLPRSLEEAVAQKRAAPDALAVAGGTDVMVAINSGALHPSALLDVSHVEELQEWRRHDGHVFVGAGVTFARLAGELTGHRPLVEAARAVGSPQIRRRATLGGNVGTASPAGDGLTVLAAYDAEIVLASEQGRRRLRWDEYLVGPKRTALRPDELIVGVEWAAVDGPGSFAKVGTRNAMVIAIASVALQLDVANRTVRLALGSVGPTVLRARAAEAYAAEALPWAEPAQPLAEETIGEFGLLASRAAQPIDDLRGTAAYRRRAIDVLARRTLAWTYDDWRAGRC